MSLRRFEVALAAALISLLAGGVLSFVLGALRTAFILFRFGLFPTQDELAAPFAIQWFLTGMATLWAYYSARTSIYKRRMRRAWQRQ